jgi:hypothetical protein
VRYNQQISFLPVSGRGPRLSLSSIIVVVNR